MWPWRRKCSRNRICTTRTSSTCSCNFCLSSNKFRTRGYGRIIWYFGSVYVSDRGSRISWIKCWR
jgi:hypothetical protein